MEKTKRHIEFIVIDIQNTSRPFAIPLVGCNRICIIYTVYAILFAWYVSEGFSNGFCLLAISNKANTMPMLTFKTEIESCQCYKWAKYGLVDFLLCHFPELEVDKIVCIFADNIFNSSSKLLTAQKCWNRIFSYNFIQLNSNPGQSLKWLICVVLNNTSVFKNLFQAF